MAKRLADFRSQFLLCLKDPEEVRRIFGAFKTAPRLRYSAAPVKAARHAALRNALLISNY